MLQFDLVTDTVATELVLVCLAFLLSAAVGAERQRRLKSAGLRTHTLVGLGSAVFTLVSAYGFSYSMSGPEMTLDPSRIAAQIVSGIGFLGAGVIFVRQNVVNGLTTAASIWLTAAIGMACGAGMPVLAVASTLLYFAAVRLLSILGRWNRRNDRGDGLVIRYRENRAVMRVVVETATALGYKVALLRTQKLEHQGRSVIEANITFTHPSGRASDELVACLSETKGVISVSVEGDDD